MVMNERPASGPDESRVDRRDLLRLGACCLGSVVAGCLTPEPDRDDPAETDGPVDTSELNRIFSDDFESDRLDHDRWQTKFPWDARTHNFDAYVSAENAYVNDETLVLEGEDRPQNGLSYTTGVASSQESFETGYFEASIQIPPTEPGFWPAFWLTPTEPERIFPEIDIFEFFGSDPCAVLTYHYEDSDGEEQERNAEVCDERFSDDYHEYAVDWSTDRIVWFIDGEEQFRYDGSYVSDVEISIVLNFGIGADFIDEPNADSFPAEMRIDRVNVWQ
ncbi:glycoside hydrolase family 16 protein [Natronorubrum sp. FCH18a]|uniref:glycoside hydrolase family 16 protein n=1 Tax=Natronorubrum sp. FCH18a TaxID=3447018 RepID=UPI003F511951